MGKHVLGSDVIKTNYGPKLAGRVAGYYCAAANEDSGLLRVGLAVGLIGNRGAQAWFAPGDRDMQVAGGYVDTAAVEVARQPEEGIAGAIRHSQRELNSRLAHGLSDSLQPQPNSGHWILGAAETVRHAKESLHRRMEQIGGSPEEAAAMWHQLYYLLAVAAPGRKLADPTMTLTTREELAAAHEKTSWLLGHVSVGNPGDYVVTQLAVLSRREDEITGHTTTAI
jgi:hypothetical protein